MIDMTNAIELNTPYLVYCGDNGYFLMRGGNVIRTRIRCFRKAVWKTYEGAAAAARKLNAAQGFVSEP